MLRVRRPALRLLRLRRTLSVSPRIVASRDDFSERGSPDPQRVRPSLGGGIVEASSRGHAAGQETRAPLVAAAPHSAVSQICNLRDVPRFGMFRDSERPADYKSAIQQIENLRYDGAVKSSWRAKIQTDCSAEIA